MRSYETIYIVQPDLNDDDIKVLSEKVQDTIASLQGTCYRLEDWGTRKLAYPVKKFPRGRYFYLTFEGEAPLVAELERRFRLDDKVIRYQTVKLEKGMPAPATVVEESPVEESAAEVAAETTSTESAE
ncbi:MAG TPA: 30S ribosomal protein S6 [Geobacteraceae bacterium]|nr:30S ribosomal protein S6 [Geobacteraceae bacterium]